MKRWQWLFITCIVGEFVLIVSACLFNEYWAGDIPGRRIAVLAGASVLMFGLAVFCALTAGESEGSPITPGDQLRLEEALGKVEKDHELEFYLIYGEYRGEYTLRKNC